MCVCVCVSEGAVPTRDETDIQTYQVDNQGFYELVNGHWSARRLILQIHVQIVRDSTGTTERRNKIGT